ncbi:carbohydrate ABC transporter permease [Paenibacillus gansuensis]|uniref:Carbohydrate ABC transporter permease n=1 Tax=Paenibacillus gansuensis TaxID=306542 RepID=A0ABW5PGA1_9BACL
MSANLTMGTTVNSISRKSDAIIHLMFIFYCLLCLIPVLLVAAVSFSAESSITADGYRLLPKQWSLDAYRVLFTDTHAIFSAYRVTILVTAAGTILSLLVMSLYAYPISRIDFRHKSFFSMLVFIPMLFSGGLVPFYLIYTQYLDLKDSLWALILPSVMNTFYVLVIRTFFQNTIPPALIESAKIDGAGEVRVFFQIVLPLSLPVLATVSLFSTLGYWNEWFLSLIFIDSPDKVSLQYLMYKTILNIQYLTSNSQALSGNISITDLPGETLRMAMCVIGMGPIIVAYPFFQKYFVQGLTVGAVKG